MHKDQPNESYFQSLLTRYREGTLRPEEKVFLEKYYDLYDRKEDLINGRNEQEFEALKRNLKSKIDRRIDEGNHRGNQQKRPFSEHYRYAVAAMLILCVSLGIYFISDDKPEVGNIAAREVIDIAPGTNRAVLLLGSRAQIDLNNHNSAVILEKEGIRISKTSDGRIQYVTTSEGRSRIPPEIHTISTPQGGQYEVVLADGSSILLNAGSTLRFPSYFQGNSRVVELEGEAYFEVQGNKSMPFIVKSGIQQVEVLGTRFVINAYSGEKQTQTTLLEGSVRVLLNSDEAPSSSSKTSIHLSPGEQATATHNINTSLSKAKVNIHKATAWKDGLFSFENDDLSTIMKQISRWYDLEVIYEGQISKEKFFGEIARESKLSEVLTILEYNNIHFRLEGRTLYVTANPTP